MFSRDALHFHFFFDSSHFLLILFVFILCLELKFKRKERKSFWLQQTALDMQGLEDNLGTSSGPKCCIQVTIQDSI